MSDDEALIRAIAEQPEEDTPRLALADWLDELGGEANVARAEFIRIQVELARQPDATTQAELRRREAELWVLHRHAWRESLPEIPGVNWRGFDRGFITTIDVELMNDFVRFAPRIFAAAPVLSVRILGASPLVTAELAALPELLRLRSLDLTALHSPRPGRGRNRPPLTGVLTDNDAMLLARSPGIANLRLLRLGGNHIGDAGLRALAASPYLKNLQRLDITDPVPEVRVSQAAFDELRRALPGVTVT